MQPDGRARDADGPAHDRDGMAAARGGPATDPDELAEAVAEQLAARWGVIFRDLVVRENLAVPWREVLWALRRMEARGTIRGGRFVSGFSGEQFALPEAVDLLRSVRKLQRTGERITISGADPLNLAGIVLPGPRIPALPANSVTYVDGAIPAANAGLPHRAAADASLDDAEPTLIA
jgi:ATP-dependent helicase Lhr and Lhr-like helicase